MENGSRLFIIEDDSIDIMTIRRILDRRNLFSNIQIFQDGASGWSALKASRSNTSQLPNLILADLNLPRLNGLEFLKRMKQDPILRHIPIVILTTSEDPSDRLNCYEHQCAGYLVKPIDPDLYTKKIEAFLNYWTLCATAK